MKKLINDPKNFVKETMEGILLAHSEEVECIDSNLRVFKRKHIEAGKVAIVTGGGSGHLPLFLGYVGYGLADGCAVGNVFASPSSKVMFDVTKSVDQGSGVLYLFGNYGGDRMNFDMSSEMADDEDIEVIQVLCNDDVASAPKGEEQKRRGVAGIFFAYKIAGAAAAKMLSLDEVARIAQKTVDNTRTIGIALSSCIIPEVGEATFSVEEDEIEIGMGIHGEPGIESSKLQKADDIVTLLTDKLLADLSYIDADDVGVLINSLGATPKEELYIIYRKVNKILTAKNINIYKVYIGEYATSMEMAGASISLIRLDDELKSFLDHPAEAPLFKYF